VNDAPFWSVPSFPLVVAEDETYSFRDILSAGDVDSGDGEMYLEIAVEYGSLTAFLVPSSLQILNGGSGENEKEMAFRGPLSAVNRMLDNLLYAPPTAWNTDKSGTSDSISFMIDDQGSSGSQLGDRVASLGLKATASVVLVVVRGINHAPTLRLPNAEYREMPCSSVAGQLAHDNEIAPVQGELMCDSIIAVGEYMVDEDVPTVISGVVVADIDVSPADAILGNIRVNVSVLHGTVAIMGAKDFALSVVAGELTGDRSLTFAGTLLEINGALTTLTYTSPTDYYGQDYVNVYVNDLGNIGAGGAQWVNETIPIRVNPVADAPKIHNRGEDVLDVMEDMKVVLGPLLITDTDFAAIVEGERSYSRDSSKEFAKQYPYERSVFRFSQYALISVTLTSTHGRVMLATTLGLDINNVPSVQNETERLSSYAAPGVTQEGLHAGVAGGSGESAGDAVQRWWKSIQITGRLSDINRALSLVTYMPDPNWNSATLTSTDPLLSTPHTAHDDVMAWTGADMWELDVVKISVEDTQDSLLRDEMSLRVRVHPTNDAPVLHMDGETYHKRLLVEDGTESLPLHVNTIFGMEDERIPLAPAYVRDVDAHPEDAVLVTMEATHGTIYVDDTDVSLRNSSAKVVGGLGLVFEEGSGHGDKVLRFIAPLYIANEALAQLSFQPAPDYFGGGAKIDIIVSDMGAHGYGGAKTAHATQWFVIEPVNDPPKVQIPEDFGNDALFVVDDQHYIRIEGAKYRDIKQDVNSSRYWQAGYELWRFQEPYTVYDKTQLYHREYFGAGDLQWSLRQLADMSSGTGDSHPHYFKNYKGSMYYVADDGHHGFELWRNDGALEDVSLRPKDSKNRDSSSEMDRLTVGTPGVGNSIESEAAVAPNVAMLRDIFPGTKGSHPKYLETHTASDGNEYLYFAADGVDVSWRVRPDHVDGCDSFKQSEWDSRVFYAVAHDNTWDPDYIYDCPVGYHWMTTEEAHEVFTSRGDTADERRDHMWYAEPYQKAEFAERHGRQDATENIYDSDMKVGGFEMPSSVGYLKEQKSYYDQCGWTGYTWGGKSRKYFRFADSHLTGEYKHAGWPDSLRPGVDPLWAAAGLPGNLKPGVDPTWDYAATTDNVYTERNSGVLTTSEFAGIVCVAGDHIKPCTTGTCRGRAGEELWRTDGTAEGTVRLEDIYTGGVGSKPAYLTSFRSSLYFAATSTNHGRELWRTLGGIGEAVMVSTKGYTQGLVAGSASSNPAELTVAGKGTLLFFAAEDRYRGREVWVVDANQDPYRIDIVDGTGSSDPLGFEADPVTGDVYFSADDLVHGRELWKSDGTAEGTLMVANIKAGKSGSFPKYLTWFRNQLYFQADDGVRGTELWRYNPTTKRAHLVMDINPGIAGSGCAYLTVMQSRLNGADFMYFTATDGLYTTGQGNTEGYGGSQVWRTDGSPKGTMRAFMKTDNDVYVDKKWLDVEHPARMGVFEHGLYLPASYGLHDVVVPRQGFRSHMNIEALRGVDQAVVVSDVDTAPSGNMTILLEASEGLIVLEPRTELAPSSPTFLHVLVAEDSRIDRMYIQNVLESHGHTVDVVQDGEAAYDAILAPHTDSTLKRYDLAMVQLDLDTSGGKWDGFQLARRLRVYEGGEGVNEERTPLVAISHLRGVINDKLEAASAGFDLHMTLPTVGFVQPQNENDRVDGGKFPDPYLDLTESILKVQQEKERERYEVFISRVEDFAYRHSSDVNITVLDFGDAVSLDADVESRLPGLSVGKEISLEGTPLQLNQVLRKLYFFATSGTSGNVSLTVTAIDSPLQCSAEAVHIVKSKLPGQRVKMLGEMDVTGGMCDMQHSQSTTRTIHLMVIPSNRPPVISVGHGALATAEVDVSVRLPIVHIDDPDFAEQTFKDSYGRNMLPPVSVDIMATRGRVGLIDRNGISFRRNRGMADVSFSFTAPLDVANRVLGTLNYMCRSADGCAGGFDDSVTILVNDEGFSGTGGAKSATQKIVVSVTHDAAADEGEDVVEDAVDDEEVQQEEEQEDVGYIRPGSPEEGTSSQTVGSPGY